MDEPKYVFVIVTVVYVFVFIFGVLGNVLVIYVVCTLRDMLTPTNIFLVNLSVADLLVLLVCMPSSLVEFHAREVWLLGAAMCKMTPLLEHTVAHTSILTILAISFERYYAICNPFEVLYACTKRRAMKIISCIWIFSIAAALPLFFMTETRRTKHLSGEMVIICRTPVRGELRVGFILVKMFMLFLLPLVILVVLYAIICRRLRRHVLKTTLRTHGSRRQVIYMLITIIVLFFICLFPIKIMTLWSIFSSSQDKKAMGLEGYLIVLSFTRVMFYMNSAGNPVLYNIVSTKFRNACRRAMGCGKQPLQKTGSISRQYTHVTGSRRPSRTDFQETNRQDYKRSQERIAMASVIHVSNHLNSKDIVEC
ncbi:hypothetical protein CAPTEDRAFT_134925 [Capitella teleta]|uniref:G-protein coupled receptors family 1 profile domain-containing protein n=1 Tax=Capitella teleta TaxID=283909 RepID=R7TTI3_CAPTE|nr:hypothetical protein CAPTEDRAFT_134925 [Capitella teleta]|eukprot:ELT97223.1 hypothetical protein CAPTEDRAFT_134925 [Capitella teleta]